MKALYIKYYHHNKITEYCLVNLVNIRVIIMHQVNCGEIRGNMTNRDNLWQIKVHAHNHYGEIRIIFNRDRCNQ